MDPLAVVILAAGLGKRMGLKTPKVLVKAGGETLLSRVLRTAVDLAPELLIIVAGSGRDELEKEALRDPVLASRLAGSLRFSTQPQALGTGHAVSCALPQLQGFAGTVIILCGDVPLVRSETLRSLLAFHAKEGAALSLISFKSDPRNAYGRILRNKDGGMRSIVEAPDCGPGEAAIREFNAGIYAVESSFLVSAVQHLNNHNAQGEYYLTDIVDSAATRNLKVSALLCADAAEFQGVNNFGELAMINAAIKNEKIRVLLEHGVRIEDPQTCYIDDQAEIAPGAVIGPNVQILGASKIASGVRFEGSAWISNCRIAEGALIRFAVRAENAVIGPRASVGPFAHLRPGSILEEEVRVGNFVETKNSHLFAGSKASHLTYLGDARVGAHSNIGAGTITCNYNGINKNTTTIEDHVFIGSNSCLVAPVTIKEGAYVGAGSVITKDVERDSLALTRPELVVKKDWAKKKRKQSVK